MEPIKITTWNTDTQEFDRALKEQAIPFHYQQRSNLSGATITEYVIPIANIVVPALVTVIMGLVQQKPPTIIQIGTVTINAGKNKDIEHQLSNALNAVVTDAN